MSSARAERAGKPKAPCATSSAASASAGLFPRGFTLRSASSLPPPFRELPPPPSSASTLNPQPCLSRAGLGALSRPELWMWVPDNSTAPLKMDSRYTSSAGLGDLNQLSTAIPATRVEVSVSCR